jgi:2-polyprenyl-6-methoxyphenol hydroxylase-like FAD-dependent oxidoreductase
MHATDRPLIVGAGPVGLAAAVFLSREGIGTRVVEMRDEPSSQSKALAVNPRTLEILEGVGVTDRMLAIGLKVPGACLWRRDRLAATIDFARLKGKYRFMLALAQAATERLFEERLRELGGEVERGWSIAKTKPAASLRRSTHAAVRRSTARRGCLPPTARIARFATAWGPDFPARRFETNGSWRTWPSTFRWRRIGPMRFCFPEVSFNS